MGNVTRPELARIYTLSDPRTLEVRYVGMTTKSLKVRLRGHLSGRRGDTYRERWIRVLRSQGVKPVIAELETVLVEHRSEAERKWIAHYRAAGARLVNATEGGEGTLGYRRTPEEKRAVGEASRRRFQDPRAREAVSRVHKGKKISEENKRIVAEAATRRWVNYRASGGVVNLSPESRARLSAAAKARSPHGHMPQARLRIAEARRQFWADRKATGEAALIRQHMREGIAGSGRRAVTGLGTVQVDPDGTIHGVSGYNYGCRCGICVAASTAKAQLQLMKVREARAVERGANPRSCADCGADITYRHLRARYCEDCGSDAKVQARVRQRRKAQRSPLPPPVPSMQVSFSHLSVHRGDDEVVRYPIGGGPGQ